MLRGLRIQENKSMHIQYILHGHMVASKQLVFDQLQDTNMYTPMVEMLII